jgi:RimJ/RimL family protein N-acetyltransferase
MSEKNSNPETAGENNAPAQTTLRLVPASELTPSEHIQAFKLIADAQAQVQNLLNNQVLFHPITIATYIAAVATACRYFWGDYGRLLLAVCGVSIAWLSMTGRLNETEVAKAEHMEIEDYFDNEMLAKALDKVKSDEDSKKSKITHNKKVAKKDKATDEEATGGKFYSFAYVYNNLVVAIITARVQPSSDASGKHEIKLLGWSTLKRYRNTGLGGDLLALMLKTIKEEEEASKEAPSVVVTVETISGHAPAEKLLRRAGFELTRATKLSGLRGIIYGIERREWALTI